MLTDLRKQEIANRIELLVEANTGYVETHTDYATGIFECIGESYFDDRLLDYLKTHNMWDSSLQDAFLFYLQGS